MAGGKFQTLIPVLPAILLFSSIPFVGCDLCTNVEKWDFMNIIFVLRIDWRHYNVEA